MNVDKHRLKKPDLCTTVKHWLMKIASIDEKSWPSIDRKVGQALTDDHAKHGEADQTLTYEAGQTLTDKPGQALTDWLMTRPSIDWWSCRWSWPNIDVWSWPSFDWWIWPVGAGASFDKVRDCPGRIIILEFISKVSGFSPPEKRVRVTFRTQGQGERGEGD
jgi:hypothetical protein